MKDIPFVHTISVLNHRLMLLLVSFFDISLKRQGDIGVDICYVKSCCNWLPYMIGELNLPHIVNTSLLGPKQLPHS